MSVLKCENAQAFTRKISINVLGKDPENTLFTIPLEGIALNREELNAYMGERTFESWFDKRKDGTWVPMDWISRLPEGSITLDEKFETDGVEIIVSGKKELVFEPTEPDDDDDAPEPAARIGQIVLTPKVGGITLLAFHLQVRPGLGKENLLLQQHQYRHVTLTLGNLEQIKRKGRQQDLALEGGKPKPGDDEDDEDDEANRSGKPRNGARPQAGH
jgi:hypothetical protein